MQGRHFQLQMITYSIQSHHSVMRFYFFKLCVVGNKVMAIIPTSERASKRASNYDTAARHCGANINHAPAAQ